MLGPTDMLFKGKAGASKGSAMDGLGPTDMLLVSGRANTQERERWSERSKAQRSRLVKWTEGRQAGRQGKREGGGRRGAGGAQLLYPRAARKDCRAHLLHCIAAHAKSLVLFEHSTGWQEESPCCHFEHGRFGSLG
eukprot:scaffold272162_cov26-Tisochrysis_lutea.AAC.1